MCGIAAMFAYSSDAPEVQEQELTRIRDSRRARRPDGEGSSFYDDGLSVHVSYCDVMIYPSFILSVFYF